MPAKKNVKSVVDMSEVALPDFFTLGEGAKVHSNCCLAVKGCYKIQSTENKADFAKQLVTKVSKPAAGSTDMCAHCVKLDGKN